MNDNKIKNISGIAESEVLPENIQYLTRKQNQEA